MLIERSGLPYSLFARCMGAPPSTIRGYLDGSRPVPRTAIAAAKWTLLCLGTSVQIDRLEISRLIALKPVRRARTRSRPLT